MKNRNSIKYLKKKFTLFLNFFIVSQKDFEENFGKQTLIINIMGITIYL